MKKRSILAILLAALLALTIFTGCAASTNSMAADSAPQTPGASYNSKSEAAAAEMPMEEPAEAEEFAYDTVATTEAGGTAAETPEPDDSVADYTAKIIYTASVSIETTEFDKAVAALENQVQKIGGFVESSNVTGDTQYNSDGTTTVVNRWAYYTVRIPCDHFESFLHETEGFGNVTSTSRDAQNVTSAYTDYEARLSSLNTQEERLLDMLAKSEDVETLIALEQRLSDVRYEIESIERNLRNYDMQIKYSTVNLDLREVEVYTPTVPVRPEAGRLAFRRLERLHPRHPERDPRPGLRPARADPAGRHHRSCDRLHQKSPQKAQGEKSRAGSHPTAGPAVKNSGAALSGCTGRFIFIDIWQQICSCRRPPAAISFPMRGKRYGRKGRWGDAGCNLHLNSGRNLCFGLAFHSVVTSRMS